MEKLTAEQFAQTLTSIIGQRDNIRFIPNPGNAGDALISAGTWHILEKCGLRGRIKYDDIGAPRPASIYIGSGGGNLVSLYSNVRAEIESRMNNQFDAFILLPHTVRGHEDLLGRLDGRFHIFCRDILSLQHVQRAAPAVNAYLADDAAFSIDLKWIKSETRRLGYFFGLLLHPRALKRYLKWRASIARIRPSGGILRLMRVDEEAVNSSGAPFHMDLSAQYGSHFNVYGESELVTGDFLRVLERADVVETDRLHVGIGASLIGKKVHLFDNNYGKNAGIFQLSIQGKFPNTSFLN